MDVKMINQRADIETTRMSEIFDGKMVMVDQLWLWIVDQGTIDPRLTPLLWPRLTPYAFAGSVVTFFPENEDSAKDGGIPKQGDLRDSIENDICGDDAVKCDNCFDFAAVVVEHAVTLLLERTLNPDLQVFRIFEESIDILVSGADQYLLPLV